MNIMKTNMLLLDNKMIKDNAGNTTSAPAPVPSEDTSKAGMKALSFLGMQNLMANPKLAQEVGVMNNSSEVAFKGNKFSNAAKFAAATAAMVMAGGALTSCEKEIKSVQNQTVIVDVQPVVDAISALRADINAQNAEQNKRQQEMLDAMYMALAGLSEIQNAIQNQTLTIDQFKALVLGKMENGEFQRAAILEAIIKLQGITENEAKTIVNAILLSYENGQISFQQAMAKIQNLLKENNSLLKSILTAINDAADKADKYAKELLKQAQAIRANGETSVAQQSIMIAQNNALIEQNNILIQQGKELIDKASELNMSVQELEVVAKMLGKSITELMEMSKNEIIAAINTHVADLAETNKKLDIINNSLNNNTMTLDEAAKAIQEILGGIAADVSEIKNLLKNHIDKYNVDMAELKSIAKDIKVELQGTRNDMQKFANVAANISADIKNIAKDVENIKNNGVKLDDAEIIELLKKINIDQNMSKEQIIAKIEEVAGKLDNTNDLLTKLGFVVSKDVINAINNIGDDLKGLDGINDKLAELVAQVKSLSVAFDLHAKYAVKAHDEEMEALNDIKVNVKNIRTDAGNIKTDISELVKQGKKAETSRATMEAYLQALNKKAEDIEAKLGRIPTVDEFSVMLDKHDADNRKFYGDLIKAAGVDPAEFENIKDLLSTINKNLVDFQGTSNKLLADILDRIKAMDPTAKDYTDKLNRIIELLENFKFECNCKCDCDHNQTVHEGIIDIIS